MKRGVLMNIEKKYGRIGFVWRSCSFAEDIVPIVSVRIGSDSLVALIRHIVLTEVDIESALHRL